MNYARALRDARWYDRARLRAGFVAMHDITMFWQLYDVCADIVGRLLEFERLADGIYELFDNYLRDHRKLGSASFPSGALVAPVDGGMRTVVAEKGASLSVALFGAYVEASEHTAPFTAPSDEVLTMLGVLRGHFQVNAEAAEEMVKIVTRRNARALLEEGPIALPTAAAFDEPEFDLQVAIELVNSLVEALEEGGHDYLSSGLQSERLYELRDELMERFDDLQLVLGPFRVLGATTSGIEFPDLGEG